MILKRIFPLFLFQLLFVPALFAADPQIRIQLDPPVIGMEEQAVLTFQLDRRAQNIAPAGKRDFDLSYSGESHSSQVTVINGVVQSKSSYIYTFVLSPKKTGTFDIGKFEVTIENHKYTTIAQNLKIKVVRESQRQPANPSDPFAQIDEFFNKRSKVPVIGFKLIPRSTSALQNQQIILDGYIVSPDRSVFDFQFSQVADIRSDKCALFDISDTVKPEVRSSGGLYRKLVKRYVIYPIETGKIGIAPPNIIAVTPYGQLQLKSEVIGLDSRKLNDRSGLSYVGDLDIRFKISSNHIEAGKNCEITLTMTGNGNLKVLSNPYGDLHAEGIYLSSPVTDLKFMEFRNNKAYFRQEVKYLLMTKKTGSFQVPPLIIRYYDDRGLPRTAEIKTFTIESTEKEQMVRKESISLKPLLNLNDFRFLLFHPLILALILFFTLLPAAAAFYGRHRKKMETDPDYSRKFLAGKRLSGYFSQAEAKLKENDIKGFYTTVQNSVFFHLTGKLGMPAGSSYRDILSEMKNKQMNGEVLALFEEIHRECNQNAFSGRSDSRTSADVLEKAKRITELVK